MKKLILMCGVPGSGKSTFVDEHLIYGSTQLVCADTVRLALGNKFNPAAEPVVHAICQTVARAHMERGYDIVVDETNTLPRNIQPYIKLAKDYGYHTSLYFIDTPLDVCINRRLTDDATYPWEEIITRMSKNLKENYETIKSMVDVYYEFVDSRPRIQCL